MKFSNESIAELTRTLGLLVPTHSSFELIYVEYGLENYSFSGRIQPHANALIRTLRERADADDALTSLVEYVLAKGPQIRLVDSKSYSQ